MENLVSGTKSFKYDLQSIIVHCLLLTFMLIGLYGCYGMLEWVVKNKFQNINPVVGNTMTVEYRERQLSCLARNIYYEAGNEPFEGKVAVAQVTLNRADARGFPDDICQVIYQKNVIYQRVVCQFSWYCDREAHVRPINREVYNESIEVAKKVLLEGFRLPSLHKALYYHANYVNPNWGKKKITQIGRHIFYE